MHFLALLSLFVIACGDDSSSSPQIEESSSSEKSISSSYKGISSSSVFLSSAARSSSFVESSSSYIEQHLAWNYLNPVLSYGEYIDDRDDHVYKYIEYENFRFMAENLNYADSMATTNLKGSSWCVFNSLDSCSQLITEDDVFFGRSINFGAKKLWVPQFVVIK